MQQRNEFPILSTIQRELLEKKIAIPCANNELKRCDIVDVGFAVEQENGPTSEWRCFDSRPFLPEFHGAQFSV